jgi:hypothetical protein
MKLYGKRWAIECGLRDTKDLRFGMGMGSIHVSTPDRRDRLWLLNALAIALLTLLGAAGEALGYDRYLKSNTSKRDRVARIGWGQRLRSSRIVAHTMRIDFGHPRSSMRFKTRTAMLTSVARRASVRERSASPITRL